MKELAPLIYSLNQDSTRKEGDFTANASSGEWFEEAQAEVDPDTGVGAGLAFFYGAHILQNVGVNAAFGMSKHL